MDSLDRKTLHRLWEEDQRTFGDRSKDEMAFFTSKGIWPDQDGGFHYSMRDGKLIIEWHAGPKSEHEASRRETNGATSERKI